MCVHTCVLGEDEEGRSESEPQGQGCTRGGCSCCQLLRSVKLTECNHRGRKVKGGEKKRKKRKRNVNLSGGT